MPETSSLYRGVFCFHFEDHHNEQQQQQQQHDPSPPLGKNLFLQQQHDGEDEATELVYSDTSSEEESRMTMMIIDESALENSSLQEEEPEATKDKSLQLQSSIRSITSTRNSTDADTSPHKVRRSVTLIVEPTNVIEYERVREEEQSHVWFSRNDYRFMRARDCLIVQLIHAENFQETDEQSCRGLEHLLEDEAVSRTLTEQAVCAVLEEQRRHAGSGTGTGSENCSHDDDKDTAELRIAQAYSAVAATCHKFARLLGQRDEMEVLMSSAVGGGGRAQTMDERRKASRPRKQQQQQPKQQQQRGDGLLKRWSKSRLFQTTRRGSATGGRSGGMESRQKKALLARSYSTGHILPKKKIEQIHFVPDSSFYPMSPIALKAGSTAKPRNIRKAASCKALVIDPLFEKDEEESKEDSNCHKTTAALQHEQQDMVILGIHEEDHSQKDNNPSDSCPPEKQEKTKQRSRRGLLRRLSSKFFKKQKERKQDIILDSFVTAKKEHTTTTSREEIQFVPSDGVADIDHHPEQMGLPICNPEATKSNCKALMIESSIGADYSDYDLPEDIAHCKTLMIESSIGADYYEVPVEVPPVVMPAPNRKKRGLLRALSKGKLFRSLSFR